MAISNLDGHPPPLCDGAEAEWSERDDSFPASFLSRSVIMTRKEKYTASSTSLSPCERDLI